MKKNKAIIGYLKESGGLSAKEMMKYPARIETFVKKVKAGDPFTLTDNSQVRLMFDEEHLNAFVQDPESYMKQNPLVTDKGQKIAWGKLAKTPEFGGGFGNEKAGSGAGAAETAKAESATAAAMAIAALNGGKMSPDLLNKEALIRAKGGYNTSSSDAEILTKFQEPEWASTFVTSANLFFQNVSGANDLVFYRGTGPVKQIAAAFKKANEESGKFFSSMDKWNPSDIWAIAPGAKMPSAEDAENFETLKTFMQGAFDRGEIIGVSLKKLGANPRFEVVNKGSGANQTINRALNGLILNKKDVLFGSKDTYMNYESAEPFSAIKDLLNEKGEVQFRTFGSSDTDAIQGEVKGATASHGKIGLGNINRELKELKLREVSPNSEVKSILSSKGTEHVARMIFDMANKVKQNTGAGSFKEEQLENFINDSKEQSVNWFISKFQSVELLYIISAVNDAKIQNKFISKLVQYAKSQAPMSSIFAKIY